MNYRKVYDLLINRCRSRQIDSYTESHHIVPRCLGGTDDRSNLVDLTPREHYIAHLLLTKIYPDGEIHYKLVYALTRMSATGSSPRHKPNSFQYEAIRRRCSEATSALNRKRTLNGTNPFAGEKGSALAKAEMAKRVEQGTSVIHNLTAEQRSVNSKIRWSRMTPEERVYHNKWENLNPDNVEQRKKDLIDRNKRNGHLSAKRNREYFRDQYFNRMQKLVRVTLLPRDPETLLPDAKDNYDCKASRRSQNL